MERKISHLQTGLIIAALLLTVTVNGLANSLPINGQQTGEISDSLGLLLTPPGYVFSIWGMIYLLLAVWTGFFFSKKWRSKEWAPKIVTPFVFSCIFNMSWLLAFHYEWFNVTMLLITGLLVSIIVIHTRITSSPDRGRFDRLPFSVYMGWVSVATILNIGIVAVSNGAGPVAGWLLSGEAWTVMALPAAAGLAVAVMAAADDSRLDCGGGRLCFSEEEIVETSKTLLNNKQEGFHCFKYHAVLRLGVFKFP